LAVTATLVVTSAGVHTQAAKAAVRATQAHPVAPPARATPTPGIPGRYVEIYQRVGAEYGLQWTMLAAVGQIESHSGQSQLPGVASGTNTAGAEGPAQFEASTWARYGVDADRRGSISPFDPNDAITAMAAYLKASGAPENWPLALYAYNHSWTYVDSVLALGRQLS
jgi:membrane-bound lytic murein transglycosylase B